MRRRRVCTVIPDDLDTDNKLAKLRVVERSDGEIALPSRHEYIGRAIIGRCGLNLLEVSRHPRNDIAESRLERLAYEPPPLRPPCIVERFAKLVRHDFHDLVFETLAGAVRERQIIG